MVPVPIPYAPQMQMGWQDTACQPICDEWSLNGCYSHRLRTLVSLADVELNPLVLLKRSKTAPGDFAVVNEHIFCAAVRSDKTKALVAVKPFHSSLCHTLQLLSFRTDVRKTS